MNIENMKRRIHAHRIPSVLSVVSAALVLAVTVLTGTLPLDLRSSGRVSYLRSSANAEVLTLSPNPIRVCDSTGSVSATLTWTVDAGVPYEVRVDGETGQLIAQGVQGSGSTQVSGVRNGTRYVLYRVTTQIIHEWRYVNRRWVKVPVVTTTRSPLGQVSANYTQQGCSTAEQGPLLVRTSKSLVAKLPGYYYLYAARLVGTNVEAFSGTLDYKLSFCPKASPTRCVDSAGTWLSVTDGGVRADLPVGTAEGIYRASFRPHASTEPWSNPVQVNVGYAGDLEDMSEYWIMPTSGAAFTGTNTVTQTNYRAVIGYEPYTAACGSDPANIKTMYFMKDNRFGYWGPSYITANENHGINNLRWHLRPWAQDGWHDEYLTAIGHEVYQYNPSSLSLDSNFKKLNGTLRYGSMSSDFPGYVLAPRFVGTGWGMANSEQTYLHGQEGSSSDFCNVSGGANYGRTPWVVHINKVQLHLPKYTGPAIEIKFWEGPAGQMGPFLYVENWYFVKHKGLVRIEANAYDQNTVPCTGDPDCFVNEQMQHPMNVLTLAEYME